MLIIALVPSVVLLGAGTFLSYSLVERGIRARDWTNDVSGSLDLGIGFTNVLQQERLLSLLAIAGDHGAGADLATARRQVDHAIAVDSTTYNPLTPVDPELIAGMAVAGAPLIARIYALRQLMDAGTASPTEVFSVYTKVVAFVVEGMDLIARTAPDPVTSVEEYEARAAFYAVEAVTSAFALSAPGIIHGSIPADQLPQFVAEVGSYRSKFDELGRQLGGAELAKLRAVMADPAWKRLNAVEDTLMRRGARPTNNTGDTLETAASTFDIAQWRRDAAKLNGQLLDLYQNQQSYALTKARASGDRIARSSIVGGVGVFGLSLLVFAVALWLSGRLIRRLKRLRGETLAVADEQLPDIMERLREGREVNLDNAVIHLDYGSDEIGQVGEAFNRAQLAAVSAAVTQARTREGVRAVFLNIAHRSQVVVHKQLEILDAAEYATEDPGQLEMLFQLDHLATRERRNAENLIILGGERPGRRWRTPVPLVELVRGAIAETQDYARVRAVRLPEVHVVGAVVADLIHLLAELVDNATSFSPPQSRVEVSGNAVRGGVAVEIADQGVGMKEADLARVNETLSNPPDFSVESLSSDSRLGLFVVAHLAVRHGISIRLAESDYGGIRAIVLIPSALIAAEQPNDPVDTDERPFGRHRVRVADELREPDPFDR